jgi:hypothetical protein
LTGYGSEAALLLPGESGERLPARHELDLHVGYRYVYFDDSGPNLDSTPTPSITLTLDVFNALNLQAPTSAELTGPPDKRGQVNASRCGACGPL